MFHTHFSPTAWTMHKKDNRRIQESEMKLLKTSLQLTRRDRIKNIDIREQFGSNKTIIIQLLGLVM